MKSRNKETTRAIRNPGQNPLQEMEKYWKIVYNKSRDKFEEYVKRRSRMKIQGKTLAGHMGRSNSHKKSTVPKNDPKVI